MRIMQSRIDRCLTVKTTEDKKGIPLLKLYDVGYKVVRNMQEGTDIETPNKDFSDNALEKDIEKIESTINIAESFIELTRKIHNEEKENSFSIVSTPISQAAVPLNTVDVKKVAEEADRKIQKAMLEAKQAKLEARQAKLKLHQASIIINKLNRSKEMLMKRVKRLMYEKTKLIKKMCQLKQSKNVEKMLNDDQIKTLCRPSVRCDRWSNNTIQKALRLKLSSGSSGYKEILNQGIPLPSERTLRKRLEGIDFESGVCKQMFDILSERVSNFADNRERDCMLAIDEISTAAGEQIDQSTMTHIGLSTLPDRCGKMKEATHALVFMLGGIFIRWKLPVAYHFTPNSLDGAILKLIVETIIQKAESVGLYVHSVTSDMGSVNLARTQSVALGKTASGENIETKFNDSIAFLKSVVELFREIKIGQLSKFKPV
ncbi:vam6 vps39-like protein [Lasius niger]|uniref:Vam6 vps39-like protein n=1 Tax=Lasius niger TaxID=67767 RepID=A0A0J7NGW3_LASNI|nr:vam6 vps39-like protein [Lasius niger]